MFQNVELAFLSASSVAGKTGVPLWEPFIPVSDDDQDIEAFGPTAVYQALGLSSAPWPKDASGQAECILVRNVGGRPAAVIGARDSRTAAAIGNLKSGDTVLHSTGPNLSAQVQLKEEKRQAVILTKTGDGTTMAVILDGKNEKIQATHAGAIFEIAKNGDISLVNGSGSGLLIQGGNIHIMGTLVAGAGNPAGLAYMLGPPTGSPGGVASVPLFAAQGIAPG